MGRSGAVTIGALHGFPAGLTSFIGRADAVRAVAGLLERRRLVTVTGPGGVGKTRLAGQVARQAAGRYADGAWLVELAPVADPDQVASAVAVALGVREQPGLPAAEAVARVLARQQLLLVVDNCEQVIGAAARLCAGLLDACDDVKILATSREPLAVAGEARYRLAPLALPDPGDPAGMAGAEAVVLFADRAASADANFALDEQTGPLVARLVARLDGMPLAIELAAARVEALGVGPLLERLDDRFTLLAGADRLAPARQRSLAATVEWSYRLLDQTQRRVFRAVSVFPAGFTLEAAEAVAGSGAAGAVLRLVECSLLAPPQKGPDGRARYGMLETLRAYGARLLDGAGEREQATAALARYAVAVAEQAAAGLQTRTGERDAARWLDAEGAAIWQALAWAVAHDLAVAERLVDALGWWWTSRGRLPAVVPLLGELAGRAEPGSDQWCTAQFWLGYAAQDAADYARAVGHYTALRDAVAGRPPSWALAYGLGGRAAALASMAGRFAEAAGEARQSVAVAREAGNPVVEMLALLTLSYIARVGGDHDDAVRLARQASQITGGIPAFIAGWCAWLLAWALTEAGDLTAAESACTAGLARSRDAGDVWIEASLMIQLADIHRRAGRTGQAAAHLRHALQLAVRTGSMIHLENGLVAGAHLCNVTGRPAEALTLWAACPPAGWDESAADAPVDLLRQAREALGPGQARAAEQRGAAMSLVTAAEYALMLTAPAAEVAPAGPGLGSLSPRERELVTLVAQGRTDAQIAAQLYISVRTVHTHLDRIRDKTGCRRRADLTRLALQAGLI